MITLLIIDMQVGLFSATSPRFDAEGVVQQINRIASAVRAKSGCVIFIQHDGTAEEDLEPGSAGWQILPTLERKFEDILIRKTANDSFYKTNLSAILEKLKPEKLIISGCATDFCVDTTIRAAASRDYEITVIADGHTTGDRPHMNAATVITHHNWVWQNLTFPHCHVMVSPASEILRTLLNA